MLECNEGHLEVTNLLTGALIRNLCYEVEISISVLDSPSHDFDDPREIDVLSFESWTDEYRMKGSVLILYLDLFKSFARELSARGQRGMYPCSRLSSRKHEDNYKRVISVTIGPA